MLPVIAGRTLADKIAADGPLSPVAALQAILVDLSPGEREQVRNSLFLGVGRSDFSLANLRQEPSAFLVRTLIGGDRVSLDKAMDILSIVLVHPLTQVLIAFWAVGRGASALAGTP
mgnify:CR=1 FL=1